MLFFPNEKGQGLVEYALILVLVAIVVIVIVSLLGGSIGNVFRNIVSNLLPPTFVQYKTPALLGSCIVTIAISGGHILWRCVCF